MHNSTLPLVIRNSSSRKSDEMAITLCGLALTPKITTGTDPIDRLTVYRNPRFAWAHRSNSEVDLKESWLPVISTPTTIVGGKNRQNLPALPGQLKFERAERLAQLRYSLLTLAFVGACVLLYGFMLDVLILGKQDPDFSTTANVVAETQTQSAR